RGRDRGGGALGGALPPPAPPVHGRPDEVVPAADRADDGADRYSRLAARPGRAAAWLPVQPALPALLARERDALPAADQRAAGAAGGRARPPRGLPPRRAGDGVVSVLEVQSLTKEFPVRGTSLFSKQMLLAVEDVSFTLRPGRVTALVGESGSGKSTVAR